MNNYNLFSSACYMISYNLIEEFVNKKAKDDDYAVNYYSGKFLEIIKWQFNDR